MRAEASVLHLDLDAFFAAVEQRDKPSLRGKPVIVGGVGGRGVVATASYEARVFGVHSAMPTHEARRRCPHAAFLGGRFHAYREASAHVMAVLRELSPLVEPLSLDEAYVDLAAAVPPLGDLEDPAVLRRAASALKDRVSEVTGGLTAAIGVATSKLVAKIASDLDKPGGLVVVPPGTELDLLRPMRVSVIPGVGPATAERLRRIGVHTVDELLAVGEEELVQVVGQAHGRGLFAMARAQDDRPVVAEREAKSISVEDTYETDHVDRRLLEGLVDRQAVTVARRLRESRLSGRTVTLKVRLHDFSTHTRSQTLSAPTDDPRAVSQLARGLLGEVDTTGGVRLLGVGVSGLADWIQDDLFADEPDEGANSGDRKVGEDSGSADQPDQADQPDRAAAEESGPDRPSYYPGMDVRHATHGPGWVWGVGRRVVTVRFETAETGPGPVRSFPLDDPALAPAQPARR